MPNVDRPIGFRMAVGVGNQHLVIRFPVDSSNSTNFFVGDVVDHDGTGAIPAAADAGVSAMGIAVAVYDSDGNPIGSPNSSGSTKYLPASTAGFVGVALGLPGAIFVAQSSTSSTAPTQTDIGATLDHIAGTGDTTTARSRHELDFGETTALNTGAQFVFLGKVDDPGNAYGQHTDCYVQFNESMFKQTSTGV